MKVSQLAKRVNTTPDTVRYYTKIGLLHPVKGQENGYKFYNQAQQQRLAFILTARHLGFTVKDITEIFNETDKNNSACPIVRDIIEKRLVEIEQKFKQMQTMMTLMQKAKAEWQTMPDKMPDSHSICHLIDAFIISQGVNNSVNYKNKQGENHDSQ
jgi:DNA-binding transcriptional MerR regulator